MNLAPLILVLGGVFYVEQYRMTRGIRNNNPGNIRHGDKWKGLRDKQTDPDFAQFKTPEYGIRALYRTLLTYKNKHGLNTIRGIVTRWAPPSENDTVKYINSVSKQTDIPADKELDQLDYLKIIKAIIRHENGIQPYSDEQIIYGVSLA